MTFDDAGRRMWDCAVLGAGPAGAMTARELARRGASVLLIDRAAFPRYKVCGCCLNPRSLRLLRRAGLDELVPELRGVPLTRLRLAVGGLRAEVPLPTGAALSREAFDAALVRAAEAAGASFLPGTIAGLVPVTYLPTDRRRLRLRCGVREGIAECRVVLAATGLGGKFEEHADAVPWSPGSRVGAGAVAPIAPAEYEPGTIVMACAAAGYVGLVGLEDGRLDVAAALDPEAVKRAGGLGELAEQVIAAAGLPAVPGLADLSWKGTPYLTRRAPLLAGERLFVIGDAAGYVEPFTGEGIAWALSAAALVAPLALRGLHNWRSALANRWRAEYRWKVARRQVVCRATAALLRRPGLTRGLVRALAAWPGLARPLFRLMYRA